MTVIIDELGGNCPVQGSGTVDGQEFYFRARGKTWTMSIGGDVVAKPAWRYREPYGTGDFDAGHMSEDEARAFIHKAAKQYLVDRAPASGLPDPDHPG